MWSLDVAAILPGKKFTTTPNGPIPDTHKANYKTLEFILKTSPHKTYGTQNEKFFQIEGNSRRPEIVIVSAPR